MTNTSRITRWGLLGGVLALATFLVLQLLFQAAPTEADVTYSQNVQAVGEKKYVRTWTNYGPEYISTGCFPRGGCAVVARYWKVSRGTATVRVTTFKVTEKVRAYDYYLLDFDVTTSSRSGTGDGGAGVFRIRTTGPRLHDRTDSKSIDAKSSSCDTVSVGMSTPWPIVTASTKIGHATVCDKSADLTRSYAGTDAIYKGSLLAKIRHLTMQRWVKVAAGKKPAFDLSIVLPNDSCTKGDGKGHCVKFANGSTSKSLTIGTTG